MVIDGSLGEGGGQIVRSTLALSIVTGREVTITRIRAGRRRPGLQRQHLTAVTAAAAICGAQVEGAGIGSSSIHFRPGPVRPGNYRFDIGSAGSTSLVLQTVLAPLLLAEAPSRVELRGGTHNPLAPPCEFLSQAYLPLLRRMGPEAVLTLERAGFYPAGGGEVRVEIRPAVRLLGLELLERGELRRRAVRALVANLPTHIGERECRTILEQAGWPAKVARVEEVEGAVGPGNVVFIELEFPALTEVFTGFGRKGVRAERVAREAWAEAKSYLASSAVVGPHLADQLLLPLGLAAARGASSRFRTQPLTPHSVTHVDILARFLDIRVHVEPAGEGEVVVDVAPV